MPSASVKRTQVAKNIGKVTKSKITKFKICDLIFEQITKFKICDLFLNKLQSFKFVTYFWTNTHQIYFIPTASKLWSLKIKFEHSRQKFELCHFEIGILSQKRSVLAFCYPYFRNYTFEMMIDLLHLKVKSKPKCSIYWWISLQHL